MHPGLASESCKHVLAAGCSAGLLFAEPGTQPGCVPGSAKSRPALLPVASTRDLHSLASLAIIVQQPLTSIFTGACLCAGPGDSGGWCCSVLTLRVAVGPSTKSKDCVLVPGDDYVGDCIDAAVAKHDAITLASVKIFATETISMT